MPLVFAPTNTSLKIVRVAADDKTKKHLESLGIASGSEIIVLSAGAGSVVCKIKDGRIALDSGISAKVFVTVQ
jgi:Fe2+ transport system protein FeoA